MTENQKRLECVGNSVADCASKMYWNVLPKYINEKKYKTGIEIGTLYCGHIEYILNNSNLEYIVGIDPYKYYGIDFSGLWNQNDFDDLYLLSVVKISKFIKRCILLRTESEKAFDILSDSEVDFVFIDGNHEYDIVKKDIELYSKIIALGGMLCGHDYKNMPGVTKAVDEFCLKQNKKLIEEQGSIWIINY